jgi:glycosyltransferase involved in cell wall biosynthesis
MPPITACVITLNEEDNIRRILDSLSSLDEIIILDSGSIDKTLEIAITYPKVKIEYRKFDTYINQKNHCINLANNEWVFSLDADECLTEDLIKELNNLPENIWKDYNGIEFPRLTFYLGKWIYHGGWYPNYQLRLFQKNSGKFNGFLVHERVSLIGNIFRVKSAILHYSYRNISDHLKFIDTYSTLTAKEKFNNGKKTGVTFSILEGIYKFFQMYFIKFGFLDGKVGVIIAILGAYYNFLKYIKLYELSIQNKDKNNY